MEVLILFLLAAGLIGGGTVVAVLLLQNKNGKPVKTLPAGSPGALPQLHIPPQPAVPNTRVIYRYEKKNRRVCSFCEGENNQNSSVCRICGGPL